MYNCPNCGQEFIDKKEFCGNCGKRLIEEKKAPTKVFIFVAIGMILVGVLTCYLIINYNTDKEIAPYIDKTKITEN